MARENLETELSLVSRQVRSCEDRGFTNRMIVSVTWCLDLSGFRGYSQAHLKSEAFPNHLGRK